jgi:predicted transcriptional regulator
VHCCRRHRFICWVEASLSLNIDDGRILNVEITEKQRAIEALQALPDQATIEDAIERLCFVAKIEEGLRQSDVGELVSHDEVKNQFLG